MQTAEEQRAIIAPMLPAWVEDRGGRAAWSKWTQRKGHNLYQRQAPPINHQKARWWEIVAEELRSSEGYCRYSGREVTLAGFDPTKDNTHGLYPVLDHVHGLASDVLALTFRGINTLKADEGIDGLRSMIADISRVLSDSEWVKTVDPPAPEERATDEPG